jgi:hypothetical protein
MTKWITKNKSSILIINSLILEPNSKLMIKTRIRMKNSWKNKILLMLFQINKFQVTNQAMLKVWTLKHYKNLMKILSMNLLMKTRNITLIKVIKITKEKKLFHLKIKLIVKIKKSIKLLLKRESKRQIVLWNQSNLLINKILIMPKKLLNLFNLQMINNLPNLNQKLITLMKNILKWYHRKLLK